MKCIIIPWKGWNQILSSTQIVSAGNVWFCRKNVQKCPSPARCERPQTTKEEGERGGGREGERRRKERERKGAWSKVCAEGERVVKSDFFGCEFLWLPPSSKSETDKRITEKGKAMQTQLVLGKVIGKGATGNVYLGELSHKLVRTYTHRERERERESEREREREWEWERERESYQLVHVMLFRESQSEDMTNELMSS
jgi:hypothetical protein